MLLSVEKEFQDYMPISCIEKQTGRRELAGLARERFGDLVKAVVDIEKGIMSVGADLHSDEEAFLLEQGSQQRDLWGINLYPDKLDDDWIEFDSVINLRPSQGNRSCGVEDPTIRLKIIEIVKTLVQDA